MSRQQTAQTTEALVRPIFIVPGPFKNIKTTSLNTGSFSNATKTLDIQPPIGETWQLLYAWTMLDAASNATEILTTKIILVNGSTTVNIRNKSGVAVAPIAGEQYLLEASSTNAPLLTNSIYIRLHTQVGGAGTAATGHMGAFTRTI